MHQACGQSFDARADSQDHIDQEPHMARKPFIVTDAMRERVRSLAGLGVRRSTAAAGKLSLHAEARDDLTPIWRIVFAYAQSSRSQVDLAKNF